MSLDKLTLDFIELENLIDQRIIDYFSQRVPRAIPKINHRLDSKLIEIKFIYNSLTDVWDIEVNGYLLDNYIYSLKDTEKVKREIATLLCTNTTI